MRKAICAKSTIIRRKKPGAMKSFPVLAILVLAFSALSSAVADDYTDELVGFSFVKLAGWTLNPRAPLNAGPGTCVGMQDTDAPEYEFITICGKPDITESAGINQALRSGFSNYIAWRAATLAAGTQLTVRPSSLVAGTIGGQESLAVICRLRQGQ
jgi:hypothetical protein